jgi:hypothetical protein
MNVSLLPDDLRLSTRLPITEKVVDAREPFL